MNRLTPRGSQSRHGALLAHESTVELSHSSSHGANRHSCHTGKSISNVRRDAHCGASIACSWVGGDTRSRLRIVGGRTVRHAYQR
eukprot:3915894-Prymnesium_polylepis.1